MTPAPLNPQRPRPPGSLQPPDPAVRRPAIVAVVFWIDMRTKTEGGLKAGWHPGFTEIICAEPPKEAGDRAAGWVIEEWEDSYWAGRDNVIVSGVRFPDENET